MDSPQQPGVDNIVSVEGSATELSHGGDFIPMGIMPAGMEGIVCPYCTGSAWRANTIGFTERNFLAVFLASLPLKISPIVVVLKILPGTH